MYAQQNSYIHNTIVKRVVETNNRNKYCFCCIFSLAFTAKQTNTRRLVHLPQHHCCIQTKYPLHVCTKRHSEEIKGGEGKGGRNINVVCVFLWKALLHNTNAVIARKIWKILANTENSYLFAVFNYECAPHI